MRLLALEIAKACHQSQFGLAVSPAEVRDITRDPFDKNQPVFEKMQIEMVQSGLFGDAEEIDDFIADKVFVGISPKIGAAHEEDYGEVTDENIT